MYQTVREYTYHVSQYSIHLVLNHYYLRFHTLNYVKVVYVCSSGGGAEDLESGGPFCKGEAVAAVGEYGGRGIGGYCGPAIGELGCPAMTVEYDGGGCAIAVDWG